MTSFLPFAPRRTVTASPVLAELQKPELQQPSANAYQHANPFASFLGGNADFSGALGDRMERGHFGGPMRKGERFGGLQDALMQQKRRNTFGGPGTENGVI